MDTMQQATDWASILVWWAITLSILIVTALVARYGPEF